LRLSRSHIRSNNIATLRHLSLVIGRLRKSKGQMTTENYGYIARLPVSRVPVIVKTLKPISASVN
jgi:hypothetical protein